MEEVKRYEYVVVSSCGTKVCSSVEAVGITKAIEEIDSKFRKFVIIPGETWELVSIEKQSQ